MPTQHDLILELDLLRRKTMHLERKWMQQVDDEIEWAYQELRKVHGDNAEIVTKDEPESSFLKVQLTGQTHLWITSPIKGERGNSSQYMVFHCRHGLKNTTQTLLQTPHIREIVEFAVSKERLTMTLFELA